MKKLLSTICALMLMTSFVSCGDSQKSSSEPSSSVSKIEYVKYETDYLSFEHPSNWDIEKSSSSSGSMDSLTINADGCLILFNYSISDLLYEKLTTAELKEKWEEEAESLKNESDEDYEFLYKERYENKEITKDFVKNGQAYILVTDNVNTSEYIEFQGNGINGHINFYSDDAEDKIMSILDTIQFNSIK